MQKSISCCLSSNAGSNYESVTRWVIVPLPLTVLLSWCARITLDELRF